MSVHMKIKVNVRAWEQVEEDDILYAPDDNLNELIVDNMQHIVSGKLTIADAATTNVPLDDITNVRGISFRADQDVDISINGGASISMKRPGEGTSDNPTWCQFFLEADITSLAITKPTSIPLAAATAANVRYVCWGDPEI